MELAESRNACQEMTAINTRAGADKRRLEGEVHTLHAEIDDLLREAKNNEEKAKKAMIDAARLADELRLEQECAQGSERSRRALEYQVKDMQTKLDEAEQLAMKGGRKVVQRLEQRVRELETQVGFF